MKCQNCGAEISSGSKVCEYCGTQISYEERREQELINKQGCPKCGSSNVAFNREKQGELKGKKGTIAIRNTVGVCKDCGYTWKVTDEGKSKNSKLWLWIIGWICIFPVPLTILMLRKKDIKPVLKYGVIVIAWLFYLLIGFAGMFIDDGTGEQAQNQVIVNTDNNVEDKEDKNLIEVTLEVEPNVNDEDGTVLFGVRTNLPQGTKILVTVYNDDGYTAQDTTVILADGVGYTAEFSDKGNALVGKYHVTVTMTIPSLQDEKVRKIVGEKGELMTGKYVIKSDTFEEYLVEGEFDFEF